MRGFFWWVKPAEVCACRTYCDVILVVCNPWRGDLRNHSYELINDPHGSGTRAPIPKSAIHRISRRFDFGRSLLVDIQDFRKLQDQPHLHSNDGKLNRDQRYGSVQQANYVEES